MKLLLISLDKTGGIPPLGLAYISSYLRKYGNFDNTIIIDKEEPLKRIKKEKPDLIGISAVTEEFTEAIMLSQKIKEQFDIPVILGGVHISLLPHLLPKTFDLGIIGEGEQTMLEIIQLYEKTGNFQKDKLKDIKGIVYHYNENIKLTEPRSFIEPLDIIPYPARDMLKMKEYYLQPRRLPTFTEKVSIGTHMITTRGCPYRCRFCSSSAFWKKIRFHSAKYVVGEIRELTEKYNIKTISLFDDLFIASKKRLEEIVDLIKKECIDKRVEFAVQGRANLITEEICKLLKEMNVKAIQFGFESNSEKVLNYLKSESVTPRDNEKAVEICKKYGLSVYGSFIIGNPFETKADVEETFNFIKKYVSHDVRIYTMIPLPGTEVWEEAKRRGMVSENMSNWNNFDVCVKDNQKIYFVPEDMTKKEFSEKLEEIRNFVIENEKKRRIEIKAKYFFNPKVIKKMLRNPKEAWYYFNRIIKDDIK